MGYASCHPSLIISQWFNTPLQKDPKQRNLWVRSENLQSGCLQPGDLQSRSTNLGARQALSRLRAYSLGAYRLALQFFQPGMHSLDWEPTVLRSRFWCRRCAHRTGVLWSGGLCILAAWKHSLDWWATVWAPTVWGPTVSCYRIWSQGSTHWTGCLYSGRLQSHATGFGAREALTGLGAYSDATDFGSGKALTGLRAYNLAACSLKTYSLTLTHWVPTVWVLTVWGPTVWRPTVSRYQF